MRKKWFLIAPFAFLGMVVFAFLGGWIVMWLWNWLTPQAFGWHPLTFWQALALLALCRILFGRWGGGGMVGPRVRRRMAERWESMTPEDRERFRQGMRGRCGFTETAPESKTP